MLSLAEVDAAVTAIWPTFTHRAAILRAFRAVDPRAKGLIDPGSFGSLLAYLSAFASILDEFDAIDTSHDHRLSDSTITKEEVVGACALLKVGVTTAEARQAFDRMEQVRTNHILFDDFAGWIAEKKIGLPPLRARRVPAPRAGPVLSTPRSPTSPQRRQATSPTSPRWGTPGAARPARASTPSGRQARSGRPMTQSTVDRLHNEDRDRRAKREARALEVQREREEAEVAELQTAPMLNQTSLDIAKRVRQVGGGASSSAGTSFLDRENIAAEARERKLETHRSVLKSEQEETIVKGSKMNANSHIILEKTGRLPNTPIADRLHSQARAQQEKARLKRESEVVAEAKRGNTVYSAYVPGGRTRPGRTPRVLSLNTERERIESAGDRLMQQAREKHKKLDQARREANDARLTGLFTPKLSAGSKGMDVPARYLEGALGPTDKVRRYPSAGSPEEPEPEPEPEASLGPVEVEAEKRRRRLERREQQMRQREHASSLQQSASSSQRKRKEQRQKHIQQRDHQMGSLAENMQKARESVVGSKHAKQTQHAKHSEFLERRQQYSSPARQRRGAGARSPEARAPVLTTALRRLYEGLVSERAAREAFEKLDKDGSGQLEARELKIALRHLHMNLNDTQVAAVMDHIDTDHDGHISIDEFLRQVFKGRLRSLKRRMQAASYSLGGMDVPALFQQYDGNNSGEIEFAEFEHAARHALRLPKVDISSAELKELFDHTDTDKSGVITLDEFQELLKKNSGTAEESQMRFESTCGQVCNRILHRVDDELSTVMTCFHRFDTDSDGSIDRNELELALRELGLVLSKKELSHVMQEIDLDGDGQIEAKEFLDRLNLARHDVHAQHHLAELEAESPARLSPAVRAASADYDDATSEAASFVSVEVSGSGEIVVPGPASVHEIFLRLDTAGQNQLSLNEVAQGVTELWPSFDDAPALMRAYRAADSTGDGWISADDFQLLLGYLAFFHHRWPLFNELDEEYDGKIPLTPVRDHCVALGLAQPGDEGALATIEAMFTELDPHDKGWVAFEEFCSFAARAQHAVAAAPPAVSPRPSPKPSPKQAWGDTSASSVDSNAGFVSPIVVESAAPPVAAAAAAAPAAARSPTSATTQGLTVSDAVQRIKEELALAPAMELVDAVNAAWETLRLGETKLKTKGRVAALCEELDIAPGW